MDNYSARMLELAATWQAEKNVAQEWVGDLWISTVRLICGIPSPLDGPLWFETMVFPRGRSEGMGIVLSEEVDYGDERLQERYETREQALAGHAVAVARALLGELGS